MREVAVRIGELATRAGVSVRSLRYYEEQGLLASGRTAGGQRTYPEDAVERVRTIQQFYAAGLTSRAVAVLLPCLHTCVATPAMLERLVLERDRVHRQATELARTRDRLDRMIAEAREHALVRSQSPSGSCTHP